MAIKGGINYGMLDKAMTDWSGIYMDRAARQIDLDIEAGYKKRQEAEQRKMRDMQYAQLKADQMNKLVVSSKSPHKTAQDYAQMMSHHLVDRQASLVDKLEAGDIDSTQFAAESAKISGQVPQIKGFITQFDTGLGIYTSGLAQKSLSAAMSPQDDSLWKAIADGAGEFAMDENNILVYRGKTENGDDFSFPANKLNQMPMPLLKVDSFEQNTLPIAINLAKPVDTQLPNGEWVKQSMGLNDPRFKETIRASFDTFLAQNGGEDGLRSLAADHAGYTRERIDKLLNSGTYEGPDGEEYANQLEYEMEQDWLASAADQYQNYVTQQFNGPMYNAQTQRMQAETNRRNSLLQQQSGRTKGEREAYQALNYLKNLAPPTDVNNLNKWLSNKSSKANWRVVPDKNSGKQYLINGRDEKTAIELTEDVLKDPNRLAQLLAGVVWNVGPQLYEFKY
tara:strand:+ start:539 stop:1888 length:1350 start_codon:yes stop_codon:yes gene_type:complete